MGAMMKEDRFGVASFTFDPASVGAATTVQQTVTIPGLRVGDFVAVEKPSLNAGVGVAGARVSAADTLAITLVNASAGAVDPASETWRVFWFRPERVVAGIINP